MPAMLSGSIKFQVIRQWLQGMPRNDIAAEDGISYGAVTNIVNDWRRNLGLVEANELRDLAVILKKLNITAPQCADGFRIVSIMQRLGIAEDCFESFILDVYNRCRDIGLSPENISYYLQDLVEFSKNGLPVSKMSAYIKEKADEKIKLEEESKKLTRQIAELKQEKENYEFLRDQALQEKEITISGLDWYSNLRSELKKYSIPIDDTSKFAILVKNVDQHTNFDASKVIGQYSDLELLRGNRYVLQSELYTLGSRISELEQQRSALELLVNSHRQTMSTYDGLKSMGFGLRELNFLYDTIDEIARENDIPVGEAIKKFLSDVENQYDRKLGFEDRVQKLNNEVSNLRKEHAEIRKEMLLNPIIGPKLIKLSLSGISDQSIINIATLFEKYGAGGGEDSTDGQLMLSDLDKYSGLKAALKALTAELEVLKKEAAILVNQKRNLEIDNQMILSTYTRLIRVVDFLEGIAISLRSEILSLALIYVFTWYLLKPQIHKDNNNLDNENKQRQPLDEFAALSRSIKGEDVPIKEIKEAVLKSIQALLNRIAADDYFLAGGLLAAYDALIE